MKLQARNKQKAFPVADADADSAAVGTAWLKEGIAGQELTYFAQLDLTDVNKVSFRRANSFRKLLQDWEMVPTQTALFRFHRPEMSFRSWKFFIAGESSPWKVNKKNTFSNHLSSVCLIIFILRFIVFSPSPTVFNKYYLLYLVRNAVLVVQTEYFGRVLTAKIRDFLLQIGPFACKLHFFGGKLQPKQIKKTLYL